MSFVFCDMAKYDSMMELQLEAKVLRKAIYLEWDKNLRKCKDKDFVLAVYTCNCNKNKNKK